MNGGCLLTLLNYVWIWDAVSEILKIKLPAIIKCFDPCINNFIIIGSESMHDLKSSMQSFGRLVELDTTVDSSVVDWLMVCVVTWDQ